MKELRKLLSKNPEVALGVAVFAGLAVGAGWIPLPSLGSLLPSSAGGSAAPATPAAQPGQVAAAAPAVAPAGDMWG